MPTFGELVEGHQKVNKFLMTRRNDETREYTMAIISSLTQDRWRDVRDLVQSLVPQKIPTEGTFFRIIKDLLEFGIVERMIDDTVSRRGRQPTLYRLKVAYKPPNSIEEGEETSKIALRYTQLAAAKTIIKELGIENPDAAIAERVDQMYGVHVVPDDETTEN